MSAVGVASGNILEARRLGKRLQGHWLWRNLSFVLHLGESLAVQGASGSGKTVLLRALAGLEPVTEGEVLLQGVPISSGSMTEYRAGVLYLAQTPPIAEGTVLDNLRLPFRLKVHAAKAFPRDAVEEYLRQLRRPDSFLSQDALELSGGERQIVALVRALLVEPKILLLDEPTSSLDEATASQVEELIAGWLQAARERAVIWTSHHRARLERVTDRVVRLEPAS